MITIEINLLSAKYLSGDFVNELSQFHSGQHLRTNIGV